MYHIERIDRDSYGFVEGILLSNGLNMTEYYERDIFVSLCEAGDLEIDNFEDFYPE